MSAAYLHPLKKLISDKTQLSNLTDKFGTPLYVYSENRLKDNISRIDTALSDSFKKYTICYALKANSNPHLISIIKSTVPDVGADCSSPGELYIINKVGISPDRCIYTGNYESYEDLKTALKSGAHINLDDISSYYRLKKIGLPDEISFRLNPGFGEGTFPAIVTAGLDAKFGVPREKIIDAYRIAKQDGIVNFGLQCMSGSGNLAPKYFENLLNTILTIAREIEDELSFKFQYISMGGGIGIPYAEDDVPLDINKLYRSLAKIYYSFYDFESAPKLIIEPGKYIMADAGFLLTRVTGLKESYKKFIGLDAGMNTFLRPALYEAYHRIYKVGNPDAETTQTVDITGGICENTDRLAKDRAFPYVDEGDLLAIMDVGAYGYTMANQYNTRPRPAEILLSDSDIKLIRKRETINDIFNKCEW